MTEPACLGAPEDLSDRMHPARFYRLRRRYCDGCGLVDACTRAAAADSAAAKHNPGRAQGLWGGAMWVDGRRLSDVEYERWWRRNQGRVGNYKRRAG